MKKKNTCITCCDSVILRYLAFWLFVTWTWWRVRRDNPRWIPFDNRISDCIKYCEADD